MILTTEAVVLRGMKYRDTSRIVTLYTREVGKVTALAKGARRSASRFGSALSTMSHVTAVLYVKETREVQLISQCDLVARYRRTAEDLDRMAAAMAVVELVDRATHPGESSERLFRLLVAALQGIEGATNSPRNALYWFEVRFLDVLGFRPNFHSCVSCGRALGDLSPGQRRSALRLSAHGVVCDECARQHRGLEPISEGTLKAAQWFQDVADATSATRLVLAQDMENELSAVLRRFLQLNIDGLGGLRSQQVFASMAGGR